MDPMTVPTAVAPRAVPLSRLATAVPHRGLSGEATVNGVAYDSRKVSPGYLFFALHGVHTDGHDHAAAAVAAGASALVVEHPLDLSVPQLVVPSVAAAIGPLAAAYYGRPSDRLATVGVTGTNGKTTICTVLRQVLDAAGIPAGQIGTVGSHFLGRSVPTTLTTPQAPDLQEALWEMAEAGVRAVAVEASSHGLDQGRLDGIAFDVGIFTNLDREHLDYHLTMERYWEAKATLFDPARCRTAIVGVDGKWGRRLAERLEVPAVTFGSRTRADVQVEAEERGLAGLEVTLSGHGEGVTLTSPLVGLVNVENVAAAYLAARHLGVSAHDAAAGIAVASPPPGRFELVDGGQPFLVVVDYAHTAEALTALIATARRLSSGRVTVVLGARGGRDPGKRPLVGRAAATADRVVLTADSPGEEPVDQIIQAVYRGVLEGGGVSTTVEPDRRTAIDLAVSSSEPGDVVLIVGRGHEQYQHFGERTVLLDDRVAAREALAGRLAWQCA